MRHLPLITILLTMLSSTARASDWMTNQKAAAICNDVVDIINSGRMNDRLVELSSASATKKEEWAKLNPELAPITYLESSYEFSLRGERRTVGQTGGGGTCGSCSIVDIHSAVPELYPDDEKEDDNRLGNAANCDHLLFVKGEPIVVSGRFWIGESSGDLVSWIAPDGAKRALCYLKETGSVKYTTKLNLNSDLCKAAIDKNTDFLKWGLRVSTPQYEQHEQQILPTSVDSAFELNVDIDLDGRLDHVVKLDYSSGAGCGSWFQWLATLDANDTLDANTPLNKALLARLRGPIRPITESSVLAIFQYEGRPYIKGDGGKALQADSSNMSVVSVWGQSEKEWCNYTVLPQYSVLKYYPVETWPKSKRR